MKRKVFIAMLFVTVVGISCGKKSAPAAGVPNMGNLVSQLTNAINPAAFTSAFAGGKSDFLGKLTSLTDAGGLASSVSSLAGFIKPEMFKEGLSPQTIADGAAKASSMADATGLLKNLEGGLKPEAFVGDWASKRAGWLNALGMLK